MAAHELQYLSGFDNEFESEALPGALPRGQFSPQIAPFGLYTEKFSATAFTAPRANNRRTWFYRIHPSVVQEPYEPLPHAWCLSAPLVGPPSPPNPMRWSAPVHDDADGDFIDGLVTVAANGDVATQFGMAVHLYSAGRAMQSRCFVDADGELLLVPQTGTLKIRTECGRLDVAPGAIAVIPRGMKFSVDIDQPVRGYVLENYGQHLRLPERGPLGSDGLANARDFFSPCADFVDQQTEHEIVCKYQGDLFRANLDHNPFDVVAWVGNAVPYAYDLTRFNVIGSTSYDHPDPSIYTVLTAPSDSAGVANVDFVVFPPRWLVAEHTFRPPWFHRNAMSEFMGLVYGTYDAKKTGFEAGGFSLHNAFVAHGPDAEVFTAASAAELAPTKLTDTLAFMFETRLVLKPSAWALATQALQSDYHSCWQGLRSRFQPPSP
jgi:homogentisate 1,2-dioxygenase